MGFNHIVESVQNGVKIGDKIKIINMAGEPNYAGKEGVVDHIDDAGQIHGTWGGCAIIPEEDEFEILNESLDQMREKALKMKETSNAFAILYGYRVKGKEVELEPEEFATEEEYKERIKQITDSFTKLSDKDPRGNRYGKESGIELYTIYPNKNSNISESTMMGTLKAKYPVLDNTWTMGSDKTKLNNEEFELLYALADKLTESSPNQYKYEVKETYEDYGAGMKWYNIICYDKKGNSWQVLNTKDWLDLMNTKDVDKAYQDIINGDYFQDKQKDIKDMNMGELFNHMED